MIAHPSENKQYRRHCVRRHCVEHRYRLINSYEKIRLVVPDARKAILISEARRTRPVLLTAIAIGLASVILLTLIVTPSALMFRTNLVAWKAG